MQGQYRKYGNGLLTPLAMPPLTDQRRCPGGDRRARRVHPSVNRAGEPRPLFQRLGNISETALHDFVDITVFLILGAPAGRRSPRCSAHAGRRSQSLSEDYPAWPSSAMMCMAVLMCLCSEADAFVAASFTTMHPSAKLAFLVLGPMLDLKLLLMYTRVFRPRLIVTIVVTVVDPGVRVFDGRPLPAGRLAHAGPGTGP